MTFLGILIALLAVAGLVAVQIMRATSAQKLEEFKVHAAKANLSPAQVEAGEERFASPFGRRAIIALSLVAAGGVGLATFNQVFFYAQPGYVYHVRDIFGNETVVDSVGWKPYWFGYKNDWKKAMTVQFTADFETNVDAEDDNDSTSATLPPEKIVMLDQVDGTMRSTVRFKIPTDPENFLKMVHEYRTPDNLMHTSLIPAVRETMTATASMMGAEEYFSGARTVFNTEFENQMRRGIYVVQRHEVVVDDLTAQVDATANAALGEDQLDYGDSKKVVWKVEKILDKETQLPIINDQKFLDYGITVVEARVVGFEPNNEFRQRMQLKQKASADRAIAKEQRIQEEEQKLLAVAKGEREIAERQAAAKVIQIEKTTNAETEKQLAVTEAMKLKEQAQIERETAEIILQRDKIRAQSQKVLADAAAYEKRELLEADNALQPKLDAYIKVQEKWADAFSKRQVPQTVFGAPEGAAGSNTEVQQLLQLLTAKTAKDIALDLQVDENTRK